jgi:hypothetical protein
MMTNNRFHRLLLASALALAASACHGQKPVVDPAALQAYSRDSAQFVRDSIRWARAPFVIDSIARTINTDSLYRLHRNSLTASNQVLTWRELLCEQARMSGRYGGLPAELAQKRMLDTTYKPEDKPLEAALESRLHNMTHEEQMSLTVGPRTCGDLGYRAGPRPREVSGIPIYDIHLKPVRPKRP